MESAIHLSFSEAEEVRDMVAEAGLSPGDKAVVTLEITVGEISEDGMSGVPDSIDSITAVAVEADTEESDQEEPGMVSVMKGRDDTA